MSNYKDTAPEARRFVREEIAEVDANATIVVTPDRCVPFVWLAEWDGRRAVLYLDEDDFEEED
jgi:hypothetical protein